MHRNQFTTVIVQGKDEIAHIKAVKTLLKKGSANIQHTLSSLILSIVNGQFLSWKMTGKLI